MMRTNYRVPLGPSASLTDVGAFPTRRVNTRDRGRYCAPNARGVARAASAARQAYRVAQLWVPVDPRPLYAPVTFRTRFPSRALSTFCCCKSDLHPLGLGPSVLTKSLWTSALIWASRRSDSGASVR